MREITGRRWRATPARAAVSLAIVLAVVLAVVLAIMLAGCAPAPAPAPTPAPAAARPPRAAAPETGRYPPRYVAGHAVYEITAVGLVSDPADSTAHQDTVTTTTTLTYDARAVGAELQVGGEIVSRVTAASPALRRADPSAATHTMFRATVDTASGTVTVERDSAAPLSACQARDPSVDQARQLATTRPRSFIPAATWRDVVTDSSCLGGLPLVSRATRDYAVAPQIVTDPRSGANAVLIAHTSTTTMVGSGHRAGHYITMNGSGTGATEEYYDRKTGVLLSAHTAATLDLDITVSGHTQRLHQQADWRAVKKSG